MDNVFTLLKIYAAGFVLTVYGMQAAYIHQEKKKERNWKWIKEELEEGWTDFLVVGMVWPLAAANIVIKFLVMMPTEISNLCKIIKENWK